MKFALHNIPLKKQYVISIVTVIIVALLCTSTHEIMGYRVAAFILLVTVSILAMFLDILPVMLAAALSALIWDFFFIPPRFTLTVGTTEDQFLLIMYFIVALVNAALTNKIRAMEKEVRIKEEKANEARFYNTLFNSLSHELRTPITTILGASDSLQSSAVNLSEKNRRDLLNEIAIASVRLNHQVENLLSMSRLESGVLQLKKDWCDINDLVYKTLAQLDRDLTQKRITVYIPENLPLFKLDFGLMEHVLYNLVSNAVQYTPVDSGIVINADCISDRLVITVADNGKGFPEKEIGHVFDKFYRLQGSHPGGTGLGLSIARGFVEAHSGTITLKNLPVRGAVFTIEIATETSYINRLKNE
jgi:two-component system sensor histidine kinase KdpD